MKAGRSEALRGQRRTRVSRKSRRAGEEVERRECFSKAPVEQHETGLASGAWNEHLRSSDLHECS